MRFCSFGQSYGGLRSDEPYEKEHLMSSPLRERDIAQALAEREGGECEVRTPAGNIDVLTPKYLYEVKVAHQWKAALGQVLAYAQAYPDRKPRLYLFGELGGMTRKAVEEHCRAAGVGVVWHRDGAAVPRVPRPPKVIENGMTLKLATLDFMYRIRTNTTIYLPTPTTIIPQETLEAYADEALTVFDTLLDNELTISVEARFDGKQHVVKRQRETMKGHPVCYQLQLVLATTHMRKEFAVSLPGIRRIAVGFPGTSPYEPDHARRDTPELNRLRAFIFHPTFPWTNRYGHPATRVEHIWYRNYGIKKTSNGHKIGGR